MTSNAKKQGIAENSAPSKQLSPTRVLGDWFFPEVRTICNLFDLAKRPYKQETVGDIFTAGGLEDSLAFNPARSMPVVIQGETKILADVGTLARYVCRFHQMEQLYPASNAMEAERQKIDSILDVVFLHFKVNLDRIIKLTMQKKAYDAGKL